MADLTPDLQADIDAISKIPAVSVLLEIVCRTTGMGFAAVARVTDKQWIACSVHDEINFGLKSGGELILETTLCNEVRKHHSNIVIDDVELDDYYRDHPVPAMYGFRSYISVPITRKNGSFFGTLCAIDPNPAQLENTYLVEMFNLYADLISFHLHAVEEISITENELNEERRIAELREQFIAIMGHDLRNPMTAIQNSAQLLLRMELDERLKRIATIITDSSYRMRGLIDNMMDFASARMGSGLQLERKENDRIESLLDQVIAELQMSWPGRLIEKRFTLADKVYFDKKRLSQLFSNLLSNALAHGEPDVPVIVTASTTNGKFTLSISNNGKQIPDNIRKDLFQPFYRGDNAKAGKQGLGLGLYISSEIAKAHGGQIMVSSSSQETVFTFSMPLC